MAAGRGRGAGWSRRRGGHAAGAGGPPEGAGRGRVWGRGVSPHAAVGVGARECVPPSRSGNGLQVLLVQALAVGSPPTGWTRAPPAAPPPSPWAGPWRLGLRSPCPSALRNHPLWGRGTTVKPERQRPSVQHPRLHVNAHVVGKKPWVAYMTQPGPARQPGPGEQSARRGSRAGHSGPGRVRKAWGGRGAKAPAW